MDKARSGVEPLPGVRILVQVFIERTEMGMVSRVAEAISLLAHSVKRKRRNLAR